MPSPVPATPSLDLLYSLAREELDTEMRHQEALDTKAGVILGFAGVLVGLAIEHSVHERTPGLIAAGGSGFLAMVAFLPRHYPVFELGPLRQRYLTGQPDATKLVLFDALVAMVDDIRAYLRIKGWLLRAATVALVVAIGFLIAGTIAHHG
ncbi:MAG: hypothetical protein ACYCTI_10830 [Acidimicrobiales bacterium]